MIEREDRKVSSYPFSCDKRQGKQFKKIEVSHELNLLSIRGLQGKKFFVEKFWNDQKFLKEIGLANLSSFSELSKFLSFINLFKSLGSVLDDQIRNNRITLDWNLEIPISLE